MSMKMLNLTRIMLRREGWKILKPKIYLPILTTLIVKMLSILVLDVKYDTNFYNIDRKFKQINPMQISREKIKIFLTCLARSMVIKMEKKEQKAKSYLLI